MHVYDPERNKIIKISKQITSLAQEEEEAIRELQKNCGHDTILNSSAPHEPKQCFVTNIKICFICCKILDIS